MTRRARGPQWQHRVQILATKHNEQAVELSIRGAEIVRILAALAEELGEMAASEESEEIALEAHALAISVADTASLAADFTRSLSDRALRLFRSHDTIAPRCAILSKEAALKAANSIRIHRLRMAQRGA